MIFVLWFLRSIELNRDPETCWCWPSKNESDRGRSWHGANESRWFAGAQPLSWQWPWLVNRCKRVKSHNRSGLNIPARLVVANQGCCSRTPRNSQRKNVHTTFGNRFDSQTQCIICVTVRRRKARPAPAYQEKSEGLVCEAFRLLLVGNWLSHTSSSMIVLGKQVREVWKIPRIPPRASPSEEYSEFPDFSSLFTQDYIILLQDLVPFSKV